jgi:hypothetical protein
MGTIAFGIIDIASAVIGGMAIGVLPKIFGKTASGEDCCSGEEKALIVASFEKLETAIAKAKAVMGV